MSKVIKNNRQDKKYVMELLKTNNKTIINKYLFVLDNKQRIHFLQELGYYLIIYSAVDKEIMMECVMNKYIKSKLYDILFRHNTDDFNDYKELKKLEYEYYETTGKNILDVDL